MDPITIIGLIESGIAGITGLAAILKKLQSGGTPTAEETAFLKQEQAAAEARFDAAAGHGGGG